MGCTPSGVWLSCPQSWGIRVVRIYSRKVTYLMSDCHEALVSYEASEALLGEPAGADVCRVRDGCLVIVKHGLSFLEA